MRAKMQKRRHKMFENQHSIELNIEQEIFNYAKASTFISLSKRKIEIFPNLSEWKGKKKNTPNHSATDWMRAMSVCCIKRRLHYFIFNAFPYRKGNFRIGGFQFSDLTLCSSFDRSWDVKKKVKFRQILTHVC